MSKNDMSIEELLKLDLTYNEVPDGELNTRELPNIIELRINDELTNILNEAADLFNKSSVHGVSYLLHVSFIKGLNSYVLNRVDDEILLILHRDEVRIQLDFTTSNDNMYSIDYATDISEEF